jgi:hypothetical protein
VISATETLFEYAGTYFLVALFESLLRQPIPGIWLVDSLGSLKRNIQVSALDSEVKSRCLFLNEV